MTVVIGDNKGRLNKSPETHNSTLPNRNVTYGCYSCVTELSQLAELC